mgnify:CR=1 FL=1
MFLNQLNEEEKLAFSSLSIHIAEANDIIEDSEKLMILEFRKEMEFDDDEGFDLMNLDSAIAVFSKSNESIKKKVLIELLGMAYADVDYDVSEKKLIGDFAEAVGLSKAVLETETKLIIDYLKLLSEIVDTVEN